MAQYKVLSNLDHDDQSYKIGDVVDGSVLGDAAQGLVADGVIESLGLPVEIPTETEQSEEVASVTEAVAEAPATPAPLEETSGSPSSEPQEAVSEQPSPIQEQPTAEQIQQDLQSLETPSEPSNDLHIS
jgi:hypothetical protein